MSTESINREALLKLVSLVRPALSTLDFIPALKHIHFGKGFATAYNDVAAIQVALPNDDLNLNLCIPGELLIKALGSFNAENVMIQPDQKDGFILVTSGRSKLRLPTLDSKSFPLALPVATKVPKILVEQAILTGIERCLVAVGNDPTRPASMGITLDADDSGHAVLFSTDNATISRYQTKVKLKLPGDAPIIMPTFFCEQLLSLMKAYPKAEAEIEIHAGALMAVLYEKGEDEPVATLFTKSVVEEVTPLNFPSIIAKYCKVEGLHKELREIPAAVDAAIGRALLVLASEQDKATKMTVSAEHLKMLSTSDAGEASDSIGFDGAGLADNDPFFIDPALVNRGLKGCSHIILLPRILILSNKDASFIHLIAHVSK